MREELEKLIGFWERVADNGGGGYRQCADDLKRVLDADPVAKLEAMGGSVFCDDSAALGIRVGNNWLSEEIEEGPPSIVLRQSAARLLARIPDPPAGEGEK